MSLRLLAPALLLLAPATTAQLLPEVSEPPGNPTTEAKVRLGTALFWEEQLSSNDEVACGTCHRFEHGGGDPRTDVVHPGADGLFETEDDVVGSPGLPRQGADGALRTDATFGRGVQVTRRRARTPINAAFYGELFWDGRARDTFLDPLTGEVALEHSAALESQAIEPILNDVEMAHEGRTWDDVVAKISAAEPLEFASYVPEALDAWIGERTYPELFEEAFGTREVTPARLAMAIGAYERTLVSDRAPILLDDEESGFEWTELEEEGRFLFENLACVTCHPTDDGLFTDMQYHVLGIRPRSEDPCLEERTEMRQDRGRFLTPSLLNVALRGPYFHDGSKATLEDVIEFYDRGGDHGPREIGRIGLSTRQKEALLAFLRRPLTDPRLARNEGPFERPRLANEDDLVAVVEAATPAAPEAPAAPRVLVVRGDADVLANFPGEIAVEEGLARLTAPYETGAIGRVVLDGGDLAIGVDERAGAGAVTIGRLLAFRDARVELEGARLLGTLAVLSDVTLTLDVDRAWIPGDWSGAGTLRLRAPDDDARIARGPSFAGESFTGTLEVARGVLVPGGRQSTQPLSASRIVLGSTDGRGSIFKPFESNDHLPDDAVLEVVDGAISLGVQEDETFGPLRLFGELELVLSAGGFFRPPSDEATHRFPDCSDEPWSAAAELRLVGWYDGVHESDQGVDHVVFDGLTAEQLARVVFVDPVGYPEGRYAARRLETGELVPVLER